MNNKRKKMYFVGRSKINKNMNNTYWLWLLYDRWIIWVRTMPITQTRLLIL